MVAAGPTVLMAASEENSSNGTDINSTQCENQAVCSNYNQVHCSQKTGCSSKKDTMPCSSSNKSRSSTHMLDKSSRLISRLESKDNGKSLACQKITPIRETKASRLRAASITAPNGASNSKRLGSSETQPTISPHPGNCLSAKEEKPVLDSSNSINPVRERDKTYKRKSYLNRSSNMETAATDHLNQSESNDRRVKRQSNKLGYISDTISTSNSNSHRQGASNLHKKHIEPKISCQRVNTQHATSRPKTSASSSLIPLASGKNSNVQRTSNNCGHSDSEVSRRVDALTALTKATMERVERLASHTNSSANHQTRVENHSSPSSANVSNSQDSSSSNSSSANIAHALPGSPRKCSILKKSNEEHAQDGSTSRQHMPVSILKHKLIDMETGQVTPNSPHALLPVTFSPSVVEPSSHKRHGILKKRCSLDESEILRRRSCSPDVSFSESNCSEFRPILKNQRRSSLDEIIKRDQSPDPQPTSILKRKTSRGDDGDDRQFAALEPQGILKRKSAANMRANNNNHHHHHVIITADTAGPGSAEIVDSAEVRPILKKKHSREESSGNDPPFSEPRPILKKKSSTDSDEHEDKPKKTILKCSRKNSQDECSYETEVTSPKKFTMLRNRVLQSRGTGLSESDSMRPILKQPSARDNEFRIRLNLCDEILTLNNLSPETVDSFLRKRAQSVGHVQPSNNFPEIPGSVLNKRRSLELSSTDEIVQDKIQSRPTSSGIYLNVDSSQNSESDENPSGTAHNPTKSTVKDQLLDEACAIDTQKIGECDTREERNDLHVLSNISNIAGKSTEMIDNRRYANDSDQEDNQESVNTQEHYNVVRSNSVSKMTMHFKALEEKATSTDKDNVYRKCKGPRSIRYRERKVQGSDRFNTQPVTFQEVQEAVLQNQRNAVSSGKTNIESTDENVTTDDEFDPSKLSLAERVRLFNQKIATETTSVSNRMPQERHTRRRPGNRYKTQPVTSEEVEVAARASLFQTRQQVPALDSTTATDDNDLEDNIFTYQNDALKSILKPVSAYTSKVSPPKSPELEGLKLIKSVLRRETEEQQQEQLLENSDSFPRSILKSNLYATSGENNSEVKDESSFARHKNFNVDVKLQKQDETTGEHDDYADVQCASGFEKRRSESTQNESKQIYAVPSSKNIAQDTYSKIKTIATQDEADNVFAESFKTSNSETLSSTSREVYSTTKNGTHRHQKVLSKQARHAVLSKSASHHAIGHDTHNNGTFNGGLPKQHGVHLPGLSSSTTQTMPQTDENDGPSMSIADRLAALQRSGSTNWKRRAESYNMSDASYNYTINKEEWSIKQGVLADCLGKLESAAEGWKKRIAAPDVTKFTVAGKMKVEQPENLESGPSSPLIEVTGNMSDRKKKTPRPERFKVKREYVKNTASTPTSPNKESYAVIRGSFSEPTSDDSGEDCKGHNLSPTVAVPKTDDETFTSFFTGISYEKCEAETLNLDETDFDVVTTQSELLVQRRNIRIQRRRGVSKNPIKALAARTDIKSEYTEVRTGVAEKVMKQLNVEKLAKNSPLALEALAGLASTEDFSAVTLRNAAETSVSVNKFQPFKDLMLILVKGRRHVQVRLVEPVATSINSGDNFVLVTKSEVYNYIGKYSNVIEMARGAEIALSIQQNKDLGCQASQVITINEDKMTCTKSQMQKFWSYLCADMENVDIIDGGHPDEDELYESAIIDTNMVYEIKDDELIPIEKYWGAIPKIEMLDPSKVLVFDFGTEMYVWNGKGASLEKKRIGLQLATEMWNIGYDYIECAVCPITAASLIGRRHHLESDLKSAKTRPKWCLLAKLSQHVETVLFREKFLDWPNVSGIIRVKGPKMKEQTDVTLNIEAVNIDDILKENDTPVDLFLEGCHLGRGTGWFDDELKKQYVAATTDVTAWHIDEFSYTLLKRDSIGQFYSGDSYIIRWMYSITITGRELSGMPSKHSAKGRDRSVYFIWQGKDASLNEQGAAALLTVELDNDQAPQIRVAQGHEPAAFLNLFSGKMIIHSGKKANQSLEKSCRLYISCGTLASEIFLVEVPCSTRHLRSRASLILLDIANSKIYVWYGSNALPHVKKNALNAANNLRKTQSFGYDSSSNENFALHEINEGTEPKEFFNELGGLNRKLYVSIASGEVLKHTPRLFYLSCISKELKPVEILCPHRTDDLPTPFPFLQEELYQANQPALFLLDNKHELWIWQGWWPDSNGEDQSGSKAIRWQAERRAAMTMAMEYWENLHPKTTEYPIYLVWAGLEPLEFINLFPTWTYRDDIAQLNIEEGRNSAEVLTVESELARLTRSTYPPAQLLQRPLPEGVDPTRLELYLSEQHFQELLGLTKAEFQQLPSWKQVKLKKEIGLF